MFSLAVATSQDSNTNAVTGGIGALATAGPTSGTPTVSGAAQTSNPASSGNSSGAGSLTVNTGLAMLGVVAGAFALVF